VQEAVVSVDGEPTLVTYQDGKPYALTFLSVSGGQIDAVYKVLNPEKLRDVPHLVVA
jgi:hypothetical protein